MHKEFRVHDYFLGRYNCKIFLRDYFTVPESALTSNPIFSAGYAEANKDVFKSQVLDGGYQIIPVFPNATDYTFPDFKFSSGSNWPTIQESDIDQFESKIKDRLQAVVLNAAELNWLTKGLLWIGAKVVLNRMISNKIITTIKSELVKWKLLPEGK